MKTFAGIKDEFAQKDSSKIYLQSIPYDGTSTWGKGADQGFEAFLNASENMELYDIETDSEVYKQGVHLLPALSDFNSPEDAYQKIYSSTKNTIDNNKFLTFFGGEHSISIGIIQAFYEKYPDLTVLQLDAHADLRSEFLGTPYNHACAMHQANETCNLVQVGIRSMDISEKKYLNNDKCFLMHEIREDSSWVDKVINSMGNNVYISLDLDVFDPSIMPSTGTPEPGGMLWYEVLSLLRKVFTTKQVLGFDIVELAPIKEMHGPDFLAAKLYYKMLSYKFMKDER